MLELLDEPFFDRPRREEEDRLEPAEDGREGSTGGARVEEAGVRVGWGETTASDMLRRWGEGET